MENAGKLIEDEALREQIKGAGIGTSATRGEIIKKLEKIKHIEINPKTQIVTPTVKGEAIYDVVEKSMPDMLNPKLTASWEKGLDMVAKKEIEPEEFMQKLEKYIKSKFEKFIKYNLKNEACFMCQRSLLRWASKPISFFCPIIYPIDIQPDSFGHQACNVVALGNHGSNHGAGDRVELSVYESYTRRHGGRIKVVAFARINYDGVVLYYVCGVIPFVEYRPVVCTYDEIKFCIWMLAG